MLKSNILILVIDSFRSDKFFGSKKTSITPNLDKLIDNGIYFSQTISSAPSSLPAVSSILTGKYPFSILELREKIYNLKKDVPTIGEKLIKHGYTNYALIPRILTLLDLEKTFGKNIEYYDDDLTLYDGIGERVNEIIEKISKSEPWFLYLHLNDIHGDATFNKNNIPDGFYDKKNGENQYERMVSLMDRWLGKIFEKLDFKNTMVVITADHSSDVGIFDDELEQLYKNTKENRVVEKSSLTKIGQRVFSKSPDAFRPIRRKLSDMYKKNRDSIIEKRREPILEKIENDEGGYRKRVMKNIVKGTSQVFDDRFRIPLLFYGHGINEHKVINQQVRSIDIYPTIFQQVGLDISDKIDGVSLIPLISGSDMKEHPAILESRINVKEGITSNTIGVRTSKFKYFRNINDEKKDVTLYDLSKDPLEEENIQESKKEIVFEMENILKENLSRD